MSVLVNKSTKVICQGFTGSNGVASATRHIVIGQAVTLLPDNLGGMADKIVKTVRG